MGRYSDSRSVISVSVARTSIAFQNVPPRFEVGLGLGVEVRVLDLLAQTDSMAQVSGDNHFRKRCIFCIPRALRQTGK